MSALVLTAFAGSAQAQGEQREAGQVKPVCVIGALHDLVAPDAAPDKNSNAASPLIASCGGIGFPLGIADRYETFSNETLDLMIVEVERYSRKTVMLFQRHPDGHVTAQDITGDLAVASGRIVTSGIDDVAADFSLFSSEGTIALSGAEELRKGGDTLQIPLNRSISAAELAPGARIVPDAQITGDQ